MAPIREKRAALAGDPDLVGKILAEGDEKARSTARRTMDAVRAAAKI
jgi:hypothetical protein